jgi:hypothetical protein
VQSVDPKGKEYHEIGVSFDDPEVQKVWKEFSKAAPMINLAPSSPKPEARAQLDQINECPDQEEKSSHYQSMLKPKDSADRNSQSLRTVSEIQGELQTSIIKESNKPSSSKSTLDEGIKVNNNLISYYEES